MNRSIILAAILATTAQAEMFCFESVPTQSVNENPWSRHHYAIQTADVSLAVPGGLFFRSFNGIGWNEASTPRGSVDVVPLTGAAVRDVDGSWAVTILGTLWQESQPTLGDPIDSKLHYIISESWRLGSDLNGFGTRGNLHKPFVGGAYPHAQDDSGTMTVTRVWCEQ